MWTPVPQTRDAHLAQVTSWIVLGYLVVQVIASMSWQVSATSLTSIRHLAGIAVTILTAGIFIHLQNLVLRRQQPAYFRTLRWTVVALGALALPVADVWAALGISFAALLLSPAGGRIRPGQTQLVGGLISVGALLWIWSIDADPVLTVGIPAVSWLAAAVITVLTRMAIVLEDLRRTRLELARLRVEQERQRISRELHDLMGRTLVAASLRAQTALRLFEADPGACREQLERLGEDLTDGQAQLRRVVRGETIVDLDSEIASAVDLFDHLGIEVALHREDVEGDGLLVAQVLREASTNLLRHSRPRRVSLELRCLRDGTELRIINDGVIDGVMGGVIGGDIHEDAPPEALRQPSTGSGLAALVERIDAVGGELDYGRIDGQRFQVRAWVPHQPAATSPPPPTDPPHSRTPDPRKDTPIDAHPHRR